MLTSHDQEMKLLGKEVFMASTPSIEDILQVVYMGDMLAPRTLDELLCRQFNIIKQAQDDEERSHRVST